MTADELVPVYRTTDVGRAEVIRAALESEGITCAIENEHQAAFSGVLECRLHVHAADEARAREFIAAHEETGDE